MSTKVKPTFLYPHVRQYLVDEICEQIVLELEKRNWEVPGIAVEFGVCGSGEQKMRLVRYIRGENFKLSFCRVQGTLPGGNRNDTAARDPASSSTGASSCSPPPASAWAAG